MATISPADADSISSFVGVHQHKTTGRASFNRAIDVRTGSHSSAVNADERKADRGLSAINLKTKPGKRSGFVSLRAPGSREF